jgi:hypothetical protein
MYFIPFFLSNFRSESALADNKCNKLAILSLRCQSLLYLRLYKLYKAELMCILFLSFSEISGLNQLWPITNVTNWQF